MPRIFDNIELKLLPELQQTLAISTRAGSCVGHSMRKHASRHFPYSPKSGEFVDAMFWPRHEQVIIDEIDRVLAQRYGFTNEEIDFIINYDIKYRVGRDAEADAE